MWTFWGLDISKTRFIAFLNEYIHHLSYLKQFPINCLNTSISSFHTARHTFATISLGIGIELKKVSELLGHDSVKTTEIYAHLVEEHLKTAVDKWDSF